jgi:RimJ/RimL family protein N-acetyltransferase
LAGIGSVIDDAEMIPAGRYRLRPWSRTDADAVRAAFAAADMTGQTAEPMEHPGAAERWLDARIAEHADGRGWSFAVLADDTVVGNAAVTDINRRHGTGWVSYWTAEHARGRGVASAAVTALAAWALHDGGLFRLELGHRTNNAASCVVAQRAGFLVEGLERQKLRYGDARYDVELHARLATDPGPTS